MTTVRIITQNNEVSLNGFTDSGMVRLLKEFSREQQNQFFKGTELTDSEGNKYKHVDMYKIKKINSRS